MNDWHVKANDKADGNAHTAAALHVIPRNIANPLLNVLNVVSNLKLIQERLLAVAKLSQLVIEIL